MSKSRHHLIVALFSVVLVNSLAQDPEDEPATGLGLAVVASPPPPPPIPAGTSSELSTKDTHV
jgi:hypothetical protein